MHPVQKYLGWFQRFLYHVEHGEIPAPVPVVEVGQDWPLPIRLFNRDYVTIAGTVVTIAYEPGENPPRHGIVTLAQIHVPGANIPATDEITLSLLAAGGNIAARAFWQTGIASARIFMVGGFSREAGPVQQNGGPAVYVPNGWQLRIDHASVAGGQNVTCRVAVIDQSAFYPLKAPV